MLVHLKELLKNQLCKPKAHSTVDSATTVLLSAEEPLQREHNLNVIFINRPSVMILIEAKKFMTDSLQVIKKEKAVKILLVMKIVKAYRVQLTKMIYLKELKTLLMNYVKLDLKFQKT